MSTEPETTGSASKDTLRSEGWTGSHCDYCDGGGDGGGNCNDPESGDGKITRSEELNGEGNLGRRTLE